MAEKDKDDKKPFDIVAHWHERAAMFRDKNNHGAAQFCESRGHQLDAEMKREKKKLAQTADAHAEESVSLLPEAISEKLALKLMALLSKKGEEKVSRK